MDVVVPLESPFETLQALSLSQSANSGFVSALPYVYENVAASCSCAARRWAWASVLIPSPRSSGSSRTSASAPTPDVIPVEASVRDYLERIINRLEAPSPTAGA